MLCETKLEEHQFLFPLTLLKVMAEKQTKNFFLNVAQASCYEVKSQLYLALDIVYIDKEEFDKVFSICEEISKTIYGLIKHLEKKT